MKRFMAAMTAFAIMISAVPTFAETYLDVDKENAFYEDIYKATENGIFSGTGEGKFEPNLSVTRAMLVTVLGRIDGDLAEAESDFPDVLTGSWYSKYVAWAEKNNIVKGYDDGTFKPEKPVSRQEAMTILYNYCNFKNKGPVGAWAVALSYKDRRDISEYALSPAMWNAVNGYFLDDENENIRPKDYATRAELAHAMNVLFQNLHKDDDDGAETGLKVSEINDDLITFENGTVIIASGAVVLDSYVETLDFDEIKVGDKVQVLGKGELIVMYRNNLIPKEDEGDYETVAEINGNVFKLDNGEEYNSDIVAIYDYEKTKPLEYSEINVGDRAELLYGKNLLIVFKTFEAEEKKADLGDIKKISVGADELEKGKKGEGFEVDEYNVLTVFEGYDFTLDGEFAGSLVNNGIISGGTFKGSVGNNGTINGGVFERAINNEGTINGGLFNGYYIDNYGTIEGGTFNRYIRNFDGTINGGAFKTSLLNEEKKKIDAKKVQVLGEDIKPGAKGEGWEADADGNVVFEKGYDFFIDGVVSADSVVNNGIISGGTFSAKLQNDGHINDGVFEGKVENNGTIGGGTFFAEVESFGTIGGGFFDSPVESDSNKGIVEGGVFNQDIVFK